MMPFPVRASTWANPSSCRRGSFILESTHQDAGDSVKRDEYCVLGSSLLV